jgi:5-methyltetrahydropteroyltriglutamate--homocysteine methyltransferase
MINSVVTSVIGSYPVDIDRLKLFNSYENGVISSWKPYIETAVNDMIKAGVELISDGQTRDPFFNIFARKLKGIRIRDRPEVIGPIEYDKPITLDDIKYVKKIIPENNKLLGLIVGPHTLSLSVDDQYYNDIKKMTYDLANVLNKEILNISPFVDMISIDEPFLSDVYPDYMKDVLKIVLKNVNCPIRFHVCGNISSIIPNLLDLPVYILSHEFKAQPDLFKEFSEYYDNSIKICLGSVRSDMDKVESTKEIINHIQKGISVFDDNIVQIAPDCGLRLLSRNIAFEKLRNLVEAKEIVYG